MIISGELGAKFDDIYRSLLTNDFSVADAYMILADFDDYKKAHIAASDAYKSKYDFSRMSLVNIANAGIFSSDRAIKEYSNTIWNLDSKLL